MSIFAVGDRVRYYVNRRAKGYHARPGGWTRVWRKGTVVKVNRVTVVVHADGAPKGVNAMPPIDRVEYLEEQHDHS